MDAEVALVKSAERKTVAESRCGKRIGGTEWMPGGQ